MVTRRAAYLHVAGQPPERMGWIDDRDDLPSLLRQYAGYVERGGDNREQRPARQAGPGEDVPVGEEPEAEEDR